MTPEKTTLQDVVTFLPQPIQDARGYNMRVFADDVVAEAIAVEPGAFLQENQVHSRRGVVRALHARRDLAEGKLVSCARGEIWDVVVDIRPWSATYRSWEAFVLDDMTHRQVWIPPGCLHGHQVLSDDGALLRYRTTARYEGGLDVTVAHDDPAFGIPWPLAPLLSERDRLAGSFADVEPQLHDWFGARP